MQVHQSNVEQQINPTNAEVLYAVSEQEARSHKDIRLQLAQIRRFAEVQRWATPSFITLALAYPHVQIYESIARIKSMFFLTFVCCGFVWTPQRQYVL